MPCELARLGTQRPVPRPAVRRGGTIALPAAIAPQLAAHRRRSAAELAAIERSDAPLAKPLDISSRSARLSTRAARRRGAGRIPPVGLRCAKIADECLPNARPISLSASPRCQRSQISALSAAAIFRTCLMGHLTSSKVKCCDDQLNPRWKADIRLEPETRRGPAPMSPWTMYTVNVRRGVAGGGCARGGERTSGNCRTMPGAGGRH